MVQPLNVGLIGFGNIGAGVVRSLEANRAVIAERLPRPIIMKTIADKDTTTRRDAPYKPEQLTDDVGRIFNDPNIDVVIELVGGEEPARTFVARALEAGTHVVTANKALLAVHGPELMALARKNKVGLLYEAAVAGGIPIIRTLEQGLAANSFSSIMGIFNGTCNYILTRMGEADLSFTKALHEAQKLGYAEPDPTYDIEGYDTAHRPRSSPAASAWTSASRTFTSRDHRIQSVESSMPASWLRLQALASPSAPSRRRRRSASTRPGPEGLALAASTASSTASRRSWTIGRRDIRPRRRADAPVRPASATDGPGRRRGRALTPGATPASGSRSASAASSDERPVHSLLHPLHRADRPGVLARSAAPGRRGSLDRVVASAPPPGRHEGAATISIVTLDAAKPRAKRVARVEADSINDGRALC